MGIEKNQVLRDKFKTETNGDCENFGEDNVPTWEYVFWLEQKLYSEQLQSVSSNSDYTKLPKMKNEEERIKTLKKRVAELERTVSKKSKRLIYDEDKFYVCEYSRCFNILLFTLKFTSNGTYSFRNKINREKDTLSGDFNTGQEALDHSANRAHQEIYEFNNEADYYEFMAQWYKTHIGNIL